MILNKCPYCLTKYPFTKSRNDSTVLCGQCGEILPKSRFIRPVRLIGLIGAIGVMAPMILLISSTVIEDLKVPILKKEVIEANKN